MVLFVVIIEARENVRVYCRYLRRKDIRIRDLQLKGFNKVKRRGPNT
jgi:hypothetical protein